MSTLDVIRSLFDYNHALNQRVWESIAQLSDEAFLQPIDYSHGSIRDQMIHLSRTELSWLRGLQGDPAARRLHLDPDDYATREQVRRLWEETDRELVAYVAGLTDADLMRQPPAMPGPAWQALVHVANHGTDHRAQILRGLHDLGAPTFDQDLIFHLWPR